ncbi:MAG: hypothetical protein ACK4KT_05780 [Thermaurantimonas sp.]
MKKVTFCVCLLILVFYGLKGQYEKPKSVYVSPTNPLLNTNKKYDDPLKWNILYGVGVQLGLDYQKYTGSVYYKLSAYFTYNRFLLHGSYAADVSNASIFSSNVVIMNGYSQPYRSTDISAFINFKDKTRSKTVLPYVAVKVLRDEKTIESVYEYEYLRKNKIAEIHRTYKEWINFHTHQDITYRFSWGVGGSFIKTNSNFIYNRTDEREYNLDCIAFTDKDAKPSEIVLPFNQSIIGAGIHFSQFYSFSYKYQLVDLAPFKFRRNSFSITQIEVLLSATPGYNSTVATYQNAQVKFEQIESVRTNNIGFRIKRTTNEIKYSYIKPGLYTQVEAGLRPGIYSKAFPEGLYMSFGVGILL